MSTSVEQNKINQAAREWLVRLYADSPDDELKADFIAWLESDTAHHAAFINAEALWNESGFAELSEQTLSLATTSSVKHEEQKKQSNYFWPTTLVASIAAIFVSVFLLISTSTEAINYMTAIGEKNSITLSDGSQLTLGADTSINVIISSDERLVILEKGQVRFEVTHNPEAPFTVATANTQVSVLGTTFDVRLGGEIIDVSVREGTVAVMERDTQSFTEALSNLWNEQGQQTLKAGEHISADLTGHLNTKTEFSLQGNADWTNGRFVYDGVALSEIIEDINRYRNDKIIIHPTDVKQLKITTSFNINQADQVLEGLALAQSLKLVKTSQGLEIRSTN